MTKDDIIPSRTDVLSMAREAGATEWCPGWHLWTDDLERFAALIASRVAAHIRETEFKPDWNNYRQGFADGAAEEREAEAYAVPMTSEGVKNSQERWRGFNQGYKQAIKNCVDLLMIQHEAAKGSHNYWHVAANLIEAEYGVHSDD